MTQSKGIIDSRSWILALLFTDKLSIFSLSFIVVYDISFVLKYGPNIEFIHLSLFSSSGCPQHGVGGGLQ